MAVLNTSNGLFHFRQHLLYLENHKIAQDVMMENLSLISPCLDRIGINWGPAFGTLIGIVRNDSLLPWAHTFNIYVLREDEERFKDQLPFLADLGFRLVRYERRGLYFLERKGEFFKIFILHKISSELRHTGGTDFIHEKYLQSTVKWEFGNVRLNIPADLDEYLTFQYGDWITPVRKNAGNGRLGKYRYWSSKWIEDHMPDYIYYRWLRLHRKKDLERFRKICDHNGVPIPDDIELSDMRPRKYRRIFTVGVYDIIHKGHVELYRRAKGLGDYLIVAVQDSDYILKYKPDSKILNSTEDRVYMVQSVRYVDEAIVYDDVDRIIRDVDFDVFVTGPDQCHDGFRRAIEWCESHGKEHIVLGRTSGVSSSQLKNRIAEKAASKSV